MSDKKKDTPKTGHDLYGVVSLAFNVNVGNVATLDEAKSRLSEAFDQQPEAMLEFLQRNTTTDALGLFKSHRIDGLDLTINGLVTETHSLWPVQDAPLTEAEYLEFTSVPPEKVTRF